MPAENRKQMEPSEGAQRRPANPQSCEKALSALEVTVCRGRGRRGVCYTAVDNRELQGDARVCAELPVIFSVMHLEDINKSMTF